MIKWAISIFTLCILGVYKLDMKEPKSSNPEVLNRDSLKQLGHLFFFDRRLSKDITKSCSSCHDPLLAFTDGYKLSVNSYAEELLRNSPSLLNINNRKSFNWANSLVTTLENQMQRPLFGTRPVELGVSGNEKMILSRFINDKNYQKLFYNTYQQDIQKINIDIIKNAIATYINALQSRNSRYDQFLEKKDSSILNKQEWYGFQLFSSDTIACQTCHGGLDFFEPERGGDFANIGLYNCNGSYPLKDIGLASEENDSDYNGVFRIPSLRNVSLTSPYYHDGSEEKLKQVIMNYERGGREINYGDCQGDGSQHPNLDGRLQKFILDDDKRNALISFLNCLTDTSYLKDKYFINPFD